VALSSGSIDVRITPGLGRWQALLLAAVLAGSLLTGFLMGRVTAPGGGTVRPVDGVELLCGHVVGASSLCGPAGHGHPDRPTIPYRAR
jgi:hypothetical protein